MRRFPSAFRLKQTFTLTAAIALTGCAGQGLNDAVDNSQYQTNTDSGYKQMTLADLEMQTIEIEVASLDDATTEAALANYKQAVQLMGSGEAQVDSLRRMADLALTSAEHTDIYGETLADSSDEYHEDEEEVVLDQQIDKMLYNSYMRNAEESTDKEQIYAMLDLASGIAPDLEGEELTGSLQTAIRLYKSLVKNATNPEEKAEAYYLLAKAHDLAGELESSIEVLDKLVVAHPENEYYTEAQFRRGEYLFSMNDFFFAEKAYQEVLRTTEQKQDDEHMRFFYAQGLNKHGWSLFKMGDYKQALEDHIRLIDKLNPTVSQGNAGAAFTKLHEDTLRAVALAFDNLDGSKAVTKYFKKNGNRSYEHGIYDALGNHYLLKERFRDAGESYGEFVKLYPESPLAPEFSNNIIISYHKGGFPGLVLAEKETYAKSYGVKSKYWKRASDEQRNGYRELLKNNLQDLAKYHHSIAQKKGKKASYKTAISWYKEFLATAPQGDPQLAQMSHLLADAYVATKDYSHAVLHYEAAAYAYEGYEKSAEAGYASIVAYQEYKNNFDGDESGKRLLLDQKIAASYKFSETFPNHEKTPVILDNVIEDYLAKDDIEAAIDASIMLLALNPAPAEKLRLHASTTMANGYFDLENYAEAEKSYVTLLGFKSLPKKQRPKIMEQLASSVYKQAEALEKSGKMAEAAAEFLRVAQVHPKSKIRENADFDAAALYLKAKMWPEVIATLEAFRKKYPKSKHVETIPDKLANAYEQQGDFGRSAREMEKIATRYEKDKSNQELARQALWQAAEMQDKAKSDPDSLRLYKKYVWAYEKPYEQRSEAQYRIYNLYKKAGDQTKSDFWVNQMYKNYLSAGDDASTRVAYLGAFSAIKMAEPKFDAFKKTKLSFPLRKSLTRKRAAMDKALKTYTDISNLGFAEFTSAANYKIGLIYQILAKDLLESPRPKGLSMLELEQYEMILEEQALPFEDQAIDIFIGNADLVAQNIYDESVKSSFAALAELLPGRYAKFEQSEDYVDIIY